MKIRLKRSSIGFPKKIKETVRALGFNKIGKEIEIDDKNSALMGMVNKISFLIEKVGVKK